MRSTLDELKQGLSELKDFVSSIKHVNDALSSNENSEVRKFAALRRRFDNAAFIVALYASFESYIEALGAAYANLEAKRLAYGHLPTKLITKHLQRSADLLSRGRLGEGRYAGLTPAHVVANLHGCLNGQTPYVLNSAAVVWHDTNFRAKDIDEIFAAVGIENICTIARNGDSLNKWYAAAKGLSQAPADGVPSTVIVQRLNDIVERRNEVAHRGGNPEVLLGTHEMSESLGFIESLSEDIFSVVVANYLNAHITIGSGAEILTLMEKPFRKGTLVVVSPPSIALYVGQAVFVCRHTGGARWGRIQSMQLNGKEYQSLEPSTTAPEGIGIGLDFICTAKSSITALEKDDDLIWTPKSVN
ncbi:MAE_28990/MAE_18760 family HEPN-like nuclease [Comamonas sp.]|uniref:MAE_28990/MAE_18760 family HEPN-like nuclease n=1 Tax=Comamonas sp. TaxID=34028 RepID=UPI00258408A5|nr:MAE_28990/MAE_18760 family HEPN-like nuclease [Comamonas sp.]